LKAVKLNSVGKSTSNVEISEFDASQYGMTADTTQLLTDGTAVCADLGEKVTRVAAVVEDKVATSLTTVQEDSMVDNQNVVEDLHVLGMGEELIPKKDKCKTEKKQKKNKNGTGRNAIITPCNDVRNRFSILGLMTEKEIEAISVSGIPKEDSRKKKCRRCNFRSYCHLSITRCRAFYKNCFKCNGNGHFPQSKNCKATRQEKLKNNNKRQIVLESLNLKTKSTEMEINTIGCNKFEISPYLLKMIEERIRVIENCECDHEKDLPPSPLRLRGGGSEMPYKLPAFQSPFPAVDAIATIFRSLQEDWSYFNSHPVCSHSIKKENGYPCFLCYIRNISNRICKPK
jgi:hypothetical protein